MIAGITAQQTGSRQTNKLLSAVRRRSKRLRIPREGIVYAVILSLLLGAGVVGRSNMLVLVSALMFGAWFVNGVLCLILLRHTDVTRQTPQRVLAGEPFNVELTVANRKRWLSSWMLLATDHLQHADERLHPQVMFSRVPPKSERRGSYLARLTRRGKYHLGPLRLSTQFPMGLAERIHVIHETTEILVYPRLGQLTSQWRAEAHGARESAVHHHTQRGTMGDEFHRLREFRSGDDARAIHWRTTARKNELIVREFHQSRSDNLTILLDLWIPSQPCTGDRERVELAISFVASLGVEQCSNARDSRLALSILGNEAVHWQGRAGPFSIDPFLQELALCESGSAVALETFVTQAVEEQRSQGRTLLVTTRLLDLTSEVKRAATDRGRDRERLKRSLELRQASEELTLLRNQASFPESRQKFEIFEADGARLARFIQFSPPVAED